MTGEPLGGPASAYPTLRTPASICLRGPKDAFVPRLVAVAPAAFASLAWASAEANTPSWSAAIAMAAVPKNRRRSWSISSDIRRPLLAGPSVLGPQRLEALADLCDEELGLFPCREVPAFREPIVMDELRIRLLRPAPGGLIELIRKGAHGGRDG